MYDIRERDQAIRMLQILLLEISYADPDIPHLTVDGIFGDRTKRALRIFQKKNGFAISISVRRHCNPCLKCNKRTNFSPKNFWRKFWNDVSDKR